MLTVISPHHGVIAAAETIQELCDRARFWPYWSQALASSPAGFLLLMLYQHPPEDVSPIEPGARGPAGKEQL